MKTLTLKLRNSLLSFGLFAMLLFLSALHPVSGQPYPKAIPQPERQKYAQEEYLLLDSIVYEKYDTLTGLWEVYKRILYRYDNEGKTEHKLTYAWNESRFIWELSKNEYHYDLNAALSEQIQYYWDTIASQWSNNTRWLYSYGTNGYTDTMTVMYWDKTNRVWFNSSICIYSVYDESGNITVWCSYKWNVNTNEWLYQYKYEYSYNELGHMNYSCTYKGNETGNEWINLTKTEYELQDAGGNYLQQTGYDWDTETSQWVAKSKSAVTYDSEGNEIVGIVSKFDGTTSQWKETIKYEYTYDDEGNETSYISYNRDEGKDEWISNNKKSSYYTADAPAGLFEKSITDIVCWFIPAGDYIAVDLNGLTGKGWAEIFDLHGRKMISREIGDDNHIPAGNFNDGVYLFRIMVGSRVFTGKVVIRR